MTKSAIAHLSCLFVVVFVSVLSQAVYSETVRAPFVDENATDVESSTGFTIDDPHYCDHPILFTDLLKDIGFGMEVELTEITTIPVEEENEIGRMFHQEIMNDPWVAGMIDQNPDQVEYLNTLMQDVLPYVERKDLVWEVHVIDSPEFNAFCMPGGIIYFFSGLLDSADNESQVMGVLAHEMGHADFRHPIGVIQYLIALGVWDTQMMNISIEAISQITNLFQSRQEKEADAFAFHVMFQLGYSPYQVVKLWQMFEVMFEPPETRLEGSFAEVLLDETMNMLMSHPRSRLRACAMVKEIDIRVPKDKETIFYIGQQNLRSLVPRSKQQF